MTIEMYSCLINYCLSINKLPKIYHELQKNNNFYYNFYQCLRWISTLNQSLKETDQIPKRLSGDAEILQNQMDNICGKKINTTTLIKYKNSPYVTQKLTLNILCTTACY